MAQPDAHGKPRRRPRPRPALQVSVSAARASGLGSTSRHSDTSVSVPAPAAARAADRVADRAGWRTARAQSGGVPLAGGAVIGPDPPAAARGRGFPPP